jgi:hypothetical protein
MECEQIKKIYIKSCEELIICSKDVNESKCNAIEEIRNSNCILAMEIYNKNCKEVKEEYGVK